MGMDRRRWVREREVDERKEVTSRTNNTKNRKSSPHFLGIGMKYDWGGGGEKQCI